MFNFNNNNITNFIVVFLSALLGYLVQKISSRNSYKSNILKKQFSNVYLPLYKKMEDNFYCEISLLTAKEYISFFNSIKSQYYEFIDVKLINLFKEYEKNINKGHTAFPTYENICYRIDNLFEQSRRKLKMPYKSLLYKFKHDQLPKHQKYLFSSIIWYLKYYSIFFISFIVMLILFNIYIKIFLQ